MSRSSSSKIPTATSARTPSSGSVPRSGTGAKKVVSSKFELIAELGRGGMATVYLARAKSRPERLIVLKQLRSDLAENPEFLAMFLEEARLAGKLQHPNIVETYEVGQDGDTYYIAMEYLEGLSLQAILTKHGWKGKFSFHMQVLVFIEALRGLEQAYTQRDDDGAPMKIVHRDVSPPNIIVTFDGKVKLVDFGIAKAASSTIETRTGLIKGKLTYMAPEQAASGDVDSRTDIYSVGVMLWQAAAGKRRWKGIENTEVLRRLHEGKVNDSPNASSNGLPSNVDEIVLKAIAAEAEERYASASEFRSVLEALLKELDARTGLADLAAFMSTEFRGERARALEVMSTRIQELDQASPRASVPESPAIATSQAKRATPQQSAVAAQTSPTKGADEARPPRRNPAPPVASIVASNRPRKRSPVAIALFGLAIAALPAFLVVKHVIALERRDVPTEAKTTAALPTPEKDTASAAPPRADVGPVADPTPTPKIALDATATVTPVVAPHQHRKGTHHGASASPAPVDTAPRLPPPPPVSATPTPTPTPVTVATPIATASADHPSLDKQDPWGTHPAPVNRSDPWTGSSAAAPRAADPWSK